jgi:uncharacterized protein
MKHLFAVMRYLALVSSGLWAASFDCAKARTKIEKAICSDPHLSKLDEDLSTPFKAALGAHPLPSYVRVRQRDWLTTLPDGNSQRLKDEFRSRIAHLKDASRVMVYSDASQTFSHDGGDTAAELWNADGKWHLSVWGGGRIDETHYFTCEFEGSITEPFKISGNNLAVTSDGKLSFALTEATFRFVGAPDICIGLGSIPADLELKRVLKK